MIYFLDFDRTLFDTSAFLAYVIKRDGLRKIRSLPEVEAAVALDALVESGSLKFASGELAQFMYPDAKDFLDQYEGTSVVVTAGNPHLQKAKVANVFKKWPSIDLFYTGDERKGPFIGRVGGSYSAPQAFIDDKVMELDSVHEKCPDVLLYEMRRDGAPGSGAYPVIHSFLEL